MSSNTPNLDLFKKDPATDGNTTFDINTMLNENWEKIDSEVGVIKMKVDSDLAPIPTTLMLGTNVYNITNYSVFDKMEMDGRTLVNLLGKDGNGESLTQFTTTGTVALSTTQKKSGSNSIKCTSTGAVSYGYKDYPYPLDSTKQYIIGCWVYVETYAGGIGLLIRDVGTLTTRYSVSTTSDLGWQFVYIKIPTSNTLVGTGFRLLFGNTGANTATSYFDDIRIYELNTADYTAIGTTHTTSAQIDALIPYVDSMKSIFNPYVISEGKNLFDGQLAIGGISVAGADYSDTKSLRSVNYTRVVSSTQYTYKITNEQATIGVDTFYIVEYDINKTFISRTLCTVSSGAGTVSTNSATAYVRLFAYQVKSDDSNVTDTELSYMKLQLELGSIATDFTPQNQSYQFIQDTFRSNPQGTVADKLYQDGSGNYRKIKRFEVVDLDGSLAWTYSTDYTGYKRIRVPFLTGQQSGGKYEEVVKYDGKILNRSADYASISELYYNNTDSYIYFNILDNDAGWGELYTPSTAEQQAYFYGYKMNNGTFGTNYSSGTKTWIPWGAVDNTGAVTVVPTTPSTAITGGTYDYYKLQYQLADEQDVAVEVEGTLEVFEGDNQISVGAGIIVREEVIPQLGTSAWEINRTTYPNGQLDNRVLSFRTIYKNTELDTSWGLISDATSYGTYRAYDLVADGTYDNTAVYSVTYYALDMYKLGFAPQSLSAEYQGNMGAVVNKLTSDLVDARTQISVIMNEYAKRQQPNWIAPTLLNSWANYGGGYETVGYYKDEFGMVHFKGVLKTGTIPTTAFILPIGYRPPALKLVIPAVSNTLSTIEILANGEVKVTSGTNTFIAIDGISFRAGQ